MATAGIVVCSPYGMTCTECNELVIAPRSSAHVSNHEVRHFWSCENCGLQGRRGRRFVTIPGIAAPYGPADARHSPRPRRGIAGPPHGSTRAEARTGGSQGRARSAYAAARILTPHASLERIGPVFDREESALFDHDLMGRDRRARRLGGLHFARNFARNFRAVERGSGPDADSRGDKSSYCGQNDDLAHRVTLCGT